MAEEDIVFGKNRHLFGGIEPSNMKSLSVMQEIVNNQVQVKLIYELPNDTTISGQTLCTVAGAVIRRQLNERPKDEFDGELIGIVTTSGELIDATAEVDNVYYYQAFPYTTQGVYNRNPLNAIRADITPAATPEDLWMFSILPYSDSTSGLPSTILSVGVPNDSLVDGETVVRIAGVMIRRKTDGYPVDWNDGELIFDAKVPPHVPGTTFGWNDSAGIVGNTTYYYQAFPYSDQGVYNTNAANRRVVTTPPRRPAILYKMELASEANANTSSGVQIRVQLYPRDPSGVNGDPSLTKRYMIRRKTSAFSKTETGYYNTSEGELVAQGSISSFDYTKPIYDAFDTNVTPNTTYYYRAWAISDDGVAGYPVEATADTNGLAWNFGYIIDGADTNPDTRVHYSGVACDNSSFNPVTSPSDLGSWKSYLQAGKYFSPKICALDLSTGEVLAYLNPDDMTKKEDGTAFSTNGLYMYAAEFPKFFIYRNHSSSTYSFFISNVRTNNGYTYTPLYHKDYNGKEIDHIYIGLDATYYQSNIWGSQLYKVVSKGRFDSMYIGDWQLIYDLCTLIFRNTNPPTAFYNLKLTNSPSSNASYGRVKESTAVNGLFQTSCLFGLTQLFAAASYADAFLYQGLTLIGNGTSTGVSPSIYFTSPGIPTSKSTTNVLMGTLTGITWQQYGGKYQWRNNHTGWNTFTPGKSNLRLGVTTGGSSTTDERSSVTMMGSPSGSSNTTSSWNTPVCVACYTDNNISAFMNLTNASNGRCARGTFRPTASST